MKVQKTAPHQTITTRLSMVRPRFTRFVSGRPLLSFFGFLGILLLLVILGNVMRKPKAVPAVVVPIKTVQTYTVGSQPTMHIQARIDKSGVITIVAQNSGIVSQINSIEGSHVNRGQQLVSLSTSYQGGNTATLNRQLSQKNFDFITNTYQEQSDNIQRNQVLAQNTAIQAADLRSINRQSQDETQSLINVDQDILTTLDTNITNIPLTNPPGPTTDAAVLQAKQAQAGVMAALNGLRESLRASTYLNDDTQMPAQISYISRDSMLAQLDLQQKTLDLNRDVATLNLKLAQVSESLMYPATPCSGTIERVFVHIGQNVVSGTPLMSIRADSQTATAIALVSPEIAAKISRIQPSLFTIDSKQIEVYPRYISKEPTDGNLNSITYTVPENLVSTVSNQSYIDMQLPINTNYATAYPFIPLDAVYQNADTASVFVAVPRNGKMIVESRPITLGSVYGSDVEVTSGLHTGDRIIFDRTVVEGDSIAL